MTIELYMLAASIGLGFVHVIAASHSASLQRGYRWTASNRDDAVQPLTGSAGRCARALQNFIETFPLFAAAVLADHVLGRHDAVTEWGAVLYFGARAVYLPLYLFGVVLIRSLVWNVAALGIFLLLFEMVWGG